MQKLIYILRGLKSAVIAFSGGLDSAFLLKVAMDALGKDNVLAVTARSETYPESEYRQARLLARKMGARHIAIHTRELAIKNFKSNPANRCYYCKKELFKKMDDIKKQYGMRAVLDGTNYDDLKDVRYGRFAAKEMRVKSPLLDVCITKEEIRKLSRRLKLSTWNKPSFACLASRFPFHSDITAKDLRRVGKAEEYLKTLGFYQVRVRIHKDIARLEVSQRDMAIAVKNREAIASKLKKLGFAYAALDLKGYRTGSMHETM